MVTKDGITGHRTRDLATLAGVGASPPNPQTPRPRSRTDTLASRFSAVRNVTTPTESACEAVSQPTHGEGGPILRRAQDGPRSEGRHAERQRESITGRIGSPDLRRKAADVDQVNRSNGVGDGCQLGRQVRCGLEPQTDSPTVRRARRPSSLRAVCSSRVR